MPVDVVSFIIYDTGMEKNILIFSETKADLIYKMCK